MNLIARNLELAFRSNRNRNPDFFGLNFNTDGANPWFPVDVPVATGVRRDAEKASSWTLMAADGGHRKAWFLRMELQDGRKFWI